ncbi:hypothetical protein D9M72_609110 [compost metagenome]
MIDVLLSPTLAFGDGDIDRVGVVHGSGPLADDVENSAETVGVGILKEHLADPVAGPHPAAGHQDVLVAHRDTGVSKQPSHLFEVRR